MRKRVQAFISHSSVDKKFVRRLVKDLTQHSINVWFDEKNIKAGQSIAEEIQKGLISSDYLIFILTKKSVNSGWVRAEWQSKFNYQVSEGRLSVIPALLEECDIPEFLRDRKYADFTNEYETGLATLLSSLVDDAYIPGKYSNIFDTVADILDSLRSEYISIPFFGKIPIIKTLKRMPRSGKQLRLYSLNTSDGKRTQIRSLYDHVLSVAHTADCLYNVISHGLSEADILNVSRCIAFHEINEILLGDIPAYTNLSDSRRRTARIESEQRLRAVPSAQREKVANEFIWMYLSDRQKESFRHYMDLAAEHDSNVFKFYKSIDKIDPIVGVWRYIHTFRGQFGEDCSEFINAMSDFFYNPEPSRVLKSFNVDSRLIDMLSYLQNKKNAIKYYKDIDSIREAPDLVGMAPNSVKAIIEGKEMLFVDLKYSVVGKTSGNPPARSPHPSSRS